MENKISELTMLLIYLTGWEETSRKNHNKVDFRAWIFHKSEILDELKNRGLIELIPGGRTLTVTEKGNQIGVELKKKWVNKQSTSFLQDREKNNDGSRQKK